MLQKHFSSQKKVIAEKINSVVVYFFLLIIIFLGGVTKAQNVPFPFGVYVAVSDSNHFEYQTNYYQIKNMGANGIIQYLAKPNSGEPQRDSVESFNNIIAINNRTINDLPLHFTTGFYNKWFAKDYVENGIGLKKNYGVVTTVDGVQCLSTGISASNAGQLWVKGPDYYQETKYLTIIFNEMLEYNLRIRARKGALLPEEEQGVYIENASDTLLKIEVTANYLINGNEESYILETFYVTDGQLSTTFLEPLLLGQYSYNSFITNPEFDSVIIPVSKKFGGVTVWNRAEDTPENIPFLRGLQLKIYWMGKRIVYLDYLDLYDDFIWSKYIDNPTEFASDLIEYDEDYTNGVTTNLKYWLSRDEPYFLDSHEPYQIVDSILKTNNKTRLIAPFITDWTGVVETHWHDYQHADSGYARFSKKVKPHRYMSDYYPFGVSGSGNPETPRVEFLYLHYRLFETQYYTKQFSEEGFYYMPQAFGGIPLNYRRPNGKELWASTSMALALGAKGIFYWRYYTQAWNEFYGIVDENYQPTDLYYALKDEIVPRLSGAFGQTVNKLDFNFQNMIYYKPAKSTTQAGSIISFIDDITTTEDSLNTHIYQMRDSLDNQYLMVFNLPRGFADTLTAQRTFSINLTKPEPVYHNWRIKNVEDLSSHSYANSTSFEVTIPMYDCKLFSVLPVVKYGGEILTNDTVTTNISLTDNMVLYDTVFIAENKLYNINSNINLLTNGFITGNGFITTDSNLTITTNSWNRALLKGKQGSNPLLFWAAHPTLSGIISYKIYRKKESQTFELIATVSGTTYTYLDTTVNIVSGATQQNETIAEYYITCIYSVSKGGQSESAASNTIKYHRVEGSAPQKQGSEALMVYSYNLEQNYPNPFNPSTIINYEVAPKNGVSAFVQIKVFDILGKEVATLVNEEKQEGRYSVTFDAFHLSNGVYFYSMKSGDYYTVKKMILLK